MSFNVSTCLGQVLLAFFCSGTTLVAFANAEALHKGADERQDNKVLMAVADAPRQAHNPVRGSFGWTRQRPGTLPSPIELTRTWAPYVGGAVTVAAGRRAFNDQIAEAARRAGIDPALVHAVVRVESAYNSHAVSPKGAVGLMQVIPSTGRRFGIDDLLNPSANLRAGTQYLSYLLRLFEGDLRLTLAAYNAGENAVLRYGRAIPPYRETRGYVPKVLSIYESLAAQRQPEQSSTRVATTE